MSDEPHVFWATEPKEVAPGEWSCEVHSPHRPDRDTTLRGASRDHVIYVAAMFLEGVLRQPEYASDDEPQT